MGASIGIELFPTLPCALTQLVFEDCVRPWVGCAVLSTEGQLLVGGGILGWLGYGRAAGDEDEDGGEKQRCAG